ncbi:MAG: hypothetical protein K5644_06905 [Lachnospiraceae bacterium]|nr:hypothetical protein [Lachnospiraceae bacterium]
MQIDFHYYATYAAAYIAGYSPKEAVDIAYSAFAVDVCSAQLLTKLGAPIVAATTQLQMELMEHHTDIVGLQNITRIWSSFHFLPRDLKAEYNGKCTKKYLRKYRLICGPNGELVRDTIENAKGSTLQAIGIAMHVLADTWAHMYFAGTPSLVINNTDKHLFELFPDGSEKRIAFKHNPVAADKPDEGAYTASIYQSNENNIMNLGHGRIGHLPDYGYCVYKYLPAWNDYKEVIKDNPSDYNKAFRQMVYALQYIRGDRDTFSLDTYAEEEVAPYADEIDKVIRTRKILICDEWKAFGEKLTNETIEDFDIKKYQSEYMDTSDKSNTFLGKFFDASIRHKSMVTNRIYKSGSKLAGISIEQDRTKATLEMVKNTLKVGDDNV